MTTQAMRIAVALVSGIVFGFGLSLSGMLDPARVQGFLDVFGNWDPTLAFVLGGAVLVAMAGTRLAGRQPRPVLEAQFHLPQTKAIDRRLVIGSAIFGFGWGMGGFCPGPAIASLSMGIGTTALFVLFMLAGMVLRDRVIDRKRS